MTLDTVRPSSASSRGWTERGYLAFLFVGVAVVVLKLGLVVSGGPNHAAAVGGLAEGGDFRAHIFGPLRSDDLARLRSSLRPGDRFYIPDLRRGGDPNNTIGSDRAVLGFSLLPHVMVARLADATVVVRIGAAPLPRSVADDPAEQIHPGLEVIRARQ